MIRNHHDLQAVLKREAGWSIRPDCVPGNDAPLINVIRAIIRSTASAVRVIKSKAPAAVLPTLAVTDFLFFIASPFRSTESHVL
ncbi:hypothetical protein ABIB83_008469 [Bradyrhizobium sp. I1.8.5]|uniref:hypothetical protein n=1 Tax=Bradyrhizobium sp. I1.8.5 TaxID=3156365 RepID=UPI003397386A